MTKTAVISEDEVYRYELTREWDAGLPQLLYVMLNPSTADAVHDDSTIRKCAGFADRYGFGSFAAVNLFALRSRDPKRLFGFRGDPVGPQNDDYIERAADRADTIVVAWGAWPQLAVKKRAIYVTHELGALRDRTCYCLGIAAGSHPLHPLMLNYDRPLIPWKLRDRD